MLLQYLKDSWADCWILCCPFPWWIESKAARLGLGTGKLSDTRDSAVTEQSGWRGCGSSRTRNHYKLSKESVRMTYSTALGHRQDNFQSFSFFLWMCKEYFKSSWSFILCTPWLSLCTWTISLGNKKFVELLSVLFFSVLSSPGRVSAFLFLWSVKWSNTQLWRCGVA